MGTTRDRRHQAAGLSLFFASVANPHQLWVSVLAGGLNLSMLLWLQTPLITLYIVRSCVAAHLMFGQALFVCLLIVLGIMVSVLQ